MFSSKNVPFIYFSELNLRKVQSLIIKRVLNSDTTFDLMRGLSCCSLPGLSLKNVQCFLVFFKIMIELVLNVFFDSRIIAGFCI